MGTRLIIILHVHNIYVDLVVSVVVSSRFAFRLVFCWSLSSIVCFLFQFFSVIHVI